MITPRVTRLVRVRDLRAFRRAVLSLAVDGTPFDARDRLVVVPSHAAASHLIRGLVAGAGVSARVLPDFVTPRELVARLAERLPHPRPALSPAEREVVLGVACRRAIEQGSPPPFRLRPGLVAELLRLYDELRTNRQTIARFGEKALDALTAGADLDRGAARLLRQTHFLLAAFRAFEQMVADTGALDEHGVRQLLLDEPAPRPWQHVVLTVGDRSRDPAGLRPADWDLLARMPGLTRLDVVVTDTALAGALHEAMHQILPGIEEVRMDDLVASPAPLVSIPPGDRLERLARDREEEVAGFARWVRHAVREGQVTALDGVALVVRQPLPYVYLAREILRRAGVPCQTFDTLPLAAEPAAAAFDLVGAALSSNFARNPLVALLRSSHFTFVHDGPELAPRHVAAFDRWLAGTGYLGDADALAHLAPADDGIARVLAVANGLVRALQPMQEPAPAAVHLDGLLAFLDTFLRPVDDWPGSLRSRERRARAALLSTLRSLRHAYARFDDASVSADDVMATIRRWIEGQTFAPEVGAQGVHIVDADTARYGDFAFVQLAGLVESEWPDRARRNIFYPPSLLRDLGWTAESDRQDGARAAFADLLRLPSARLVVSTFRLEDDALVSPSSLLDELTAAGFDTVEETWDDVRIFEHEALALEPVHIEALRPDVRDMVAWRLDAPAPDLPRFRGTTDGHRPAAYTVSSLERYIDCPFKYFAAHVLRLEEPVEDEPVRSPLVRGRFLHDVFQRFFEAWDRGPGGAITVDRLASARALFGEVAEPLLAALPEAEAALERTFLFGSAISVGVIDVVLGLEAGRPGRVRERWLEHAFEGDFSLGSDGARRVRIKGVADRVDLLEGRELRVVDYKSGRLRTAKHDLQVPVYALCLQEQLTARDGAPWTIAEAAYVAPTARPPLRVVTAGERGNQFDDARQRLFETVEAVEAGAFPPRPREPRQCAWCAYASVCRKDYVGDE
ncbi:MAG: PD-(D/E)XK nuclease family protein [Vicinamibacterales bacterium]